MKNSEILKEVERQEIQNREIEDRKPKPPKESFELVPNLYEGPVKMRTGQRIYNVKTRVNKVPVVLKLKHPFTVYPGDELHLSIVPPFLAATGASGERYSALEINYPGKGN